MVRNLTQKDAYEELNAEALESGAEKMGISLDSTQLDKFRLYYRELIRWNSMMNLTTVTDWEGAQAIHFLDSLAIAGALPSETMAARNFVDVGAGGGFPGIPMKIAFPGLSGLLVDATAKKVEFLRNMIDVLELTELEATHARAETLGRREATRERFDMVFARAVASTPILVELTLPLCRIGGVVALHKTRAAAEEIAAAGMAIETMGGTTREVVNAGGDNKVLAIIDKTRATPQQYPRRPGIPSKRPLLGPASE